MKTDIEIAQACKKEKITVIADRAGVSADDPSSCMITVKSGSVWDASDSRSAGR